MDDGSAEIENGVVHRGRVVAVESAVVVVAATQRSPNRVDPHLRTRSEDAADRFLNLVIQFIKADWNDIKEFISQKVREIDWGKF